MKVSDLKDRLDMLVAGGKGELEILVSSDAEGNGFNELDELGISFCYDNEPVHPDDIGTEFDEEDLVQKVVIWSS